MILQSLHPLRAGLLLVILLAANVGQKVHIYREDPAHFAALCGDLLPDNGASEEICERCIVDDFPFFPFLTQAVFVPRFRAEVLCVVRPAATCCKRVEPMRENSLRAPPRR